MKNISTNQTISINRIELYRFMNKKDTPLVSRRTFIKQAATITLGSASLISGIPLSRVQSLNEILIVLNDMKIKPNGWKSQTLYFNLLKEYESGTRSYPSSEWEKAFLQLGDLLDVRTK